MVAAQHRSTLAVVESAAALTRPSAGHDADHFSPQIPPRSLEGPSQGVKGKRTSAWVSPVDGGSAGRRRREPGGRQRPLDVEGDVVEQPLGVGEEARPRRRAPRPRSGSGRRRPPPRARAPPPRAGRRAAGCGPARRARSRTARLASSRVSALTGRLNGGQRARAAPRGAPTPTAGRRPGTGRAASRRRARRRPRRARGGRPRAPEGAPWRRSGGDKSL